MHLRAYHEQTDFEHIESWISDERTHALWSADRLPYPLSIEGLHKYLSEQILSSVKEYDGAYVYVNEDDRPVGFLIYSVNEQDKSGFVRFIMVDNTSRGKGYGTAMLKEFQRFAYDRTRAAAIRLMVFDVNAAARKCYEKAGFHVVNDTLDTFSYQDETWERCMMEHICRGHVRSDEIDKKFD